MPRGSDCKDLCAIRLLELSSELRDLPACAFEAPPLLRSADELESMAVSIVQPRALTVEPATDQKRATV